MPLAPGSRLDSYEIIAPLGAGGMGEVYRARDATLKRDVAIKGIPITHWRSRSDGSDRLQLTYPPVQVMYPFISPNGKYVAYSDIDGEVYIVGMDGGAPEKVVGKEATLYPASANWSPDRKLLAFMGLVEDPNHYEIGVFDLRTRER